MDKHFVFKTDDIVCADEIRFDYIDGYIWNVEIVGGVTETVMRSCHCARA